ncbi:MAG: helix-turn-helix transcriptional regulator [Syntrophales bacterium]
MGEQVLLERFFWFQQEAGNQRFPNASKLAHRFECSIRTAQRDIDYFRCRLHAPLEYDAARRGFYCDDPGFQIPILSLNEKELLAILVSKKLLTDAAAGPLGDELGHIVAKLGAVLAGNLPGHFDPEQAFSFRSTEFTPAEPLLFGCVSNALLLSCLLTFNYYSPASRQSTTRLVEPHHLVNYMGTWHLIAFCRLRHDWRDFLLSRISACRVSEEEFVPHPETEWRPLLTDTFGIFQNRESFPVVLRFSPLRSRWVRGQIWHRDQKAEEFPDGSLQLTIPVSHEAEIIMEILKHGSHVEVLAPGWLRKKVGREIKKMQRNYQT